MSAYLPLLNKRAVVTGGSRGIGAAIVRKLAEQGALVVFTYSASPDAAQVLVRDIVAAGGRASALHADSADPARLQVAIRQAVERLGGLDILVNNAGTLVHALIDDFTQADFDRTMAINVRAPFFAMQEAGRHLQSGGRIINVSSNVAVSAAVPGASVYGLSKSALTAMTRALAHEFAPRGITVNAIQPGPTTTDMTSGMEEFIIGRVPAGRMANASEPAALVPIWLAQTPASLMARLSPSTAL
ncbi:3-oxoacyl-[acyl-carrier protein] reductase [Devosia sp. YR412]|uniref:SDR family NAD(P)-dependent oxidoreductase n=1 Tax=Devosia sp. YR412 TaxID=1881030 RepID=UPI0008C1622E|nr:SDR family NAD(P)-dependent oxidoreductase [Devosia sp. YR412]SEP81854.1 3-oxoacyl-[acyl-carrier protein] reductase [Devosia sp. YR412]